MGQTKSKNCADTKGTDYLPAQVAVNDIDILQGLAENEGPTAVSAYIDKRLNRWKKEQVTFAITGRSATGKSTFINTIRNLKPEDAGFAKTGSGDTTVVPTRYMHPKNDQITFCDLPGYSSTKFVKKDYISTMKISDYHFFFIFFNNVLSEDEKWLARKLRKLGKPFSLVRSKIDLDIDNAKHDGKNQETVISEIKEKIQITLNANSELKDTKGTFLISCRHPELGELSDLLRYVEENIDALKAQAVLFSLDCITTKIVKRKYKMLKKRIILTTALAAGIGAIPVPGLDVAIIIVFLANEVRHYLSVFGINRQRVYSLEDFDHSLLMSIPLLKADLDMLFIVSAHIVPYGGSAVGITVCKLFVPLVGSVVGSIGSTLLSYNFLDTTLYEIKEDAVMIYEHLRKTNADHRM